MDKKRQPGIQIGQIFLNEASFAHHPNAKNLPSTTSVNLDRIKMAIQVGERVDGKAAIFTIRASTDPEDSSALYQFSVEMVATATTVEGEENLPPAEFLKTAGPATLYPFLRELVANLTMRGRFGPVWLKPFNFRAIDQTWKKSVSTEPRVRRGKVVKKKQVSQRS